jgi:hypothetical protein
MYVLKQLEAFHVAYLMAQSSLRARQWREAERRYTTLLRVLTASLKPGEVLAKSVFVCAAAAGGAASRPPSSPLFDLRAFLVEFAYLHLRIGKATHALRVLELLLRADVTNVQCLLLYGEALLRLNRINDADALYAFVAQLVQQVEVAQSSFAQATTTTTTTQSSSNYSLRVTVARPAVARHDAAAATVPLATLPIFDDYTSLIHFTLGRRQARRGDASAHSVADADDTQAYLLSEHCRLRLKTTLFHQQALLAICKNELPLALRLLSNAIEAHEMLVSQCTLQYAKEAKQRQEKRRKKRKLNELRASDLREQSAAHVSDDGDEFVHYEIEDRIGYEAAVHNLVALQLRIADAQRSVPSAQSACTVFMHFYELSHVALDDAAFQQLRKETLEALATAEADAAAEAAIVRQSSAKQNGATHLPFAVTPLAKLQLQAEVLRRISSGYLTS